MQAASRISCPMYFPAAPYALTDSVTCATLVDWAYDQCTQWINQDYPSSSNFIWQLPSQDYTFSAPLFWSYTWWDDETYDEPFGFVAQNAKQEVYLVFRGTVTDADDAQDALAVQTPYPFVPNGGNVHLGFYQIYQALQSQIYAAISAAAPFKRFFFTGHSLGSALSTLAVPDLLSNTSVKPGSNLLIQHHNFASPRVGDVNYALVMNNVGVPTYRIVNTEDIIPDAPTAIFGSYLYEHVGTPIDFTAQYGSIGGNHSLDIAYEYALAHPNDPQGPMPLQPSLGLSRRPGVRLVVRGPVTRLARSAAY
jgi:triacylglycerol lipase